MADVKISALPAATTPLDGTELVPIVQGGVTERVTVADMTAGRTVAASTLNVDANTSSAAVRITQTGAGNALLVEDSASPDATPLVINAVGQLVAGHTSPITGVGNLTARIQAAAADGGGAFFSASRWLAAAGGSGFDFLKSRGASVGTNGIVSDGDTIGQIRFGADDGTAFVQAAQIAAAVDGTPGTNDMPGRLSFFTTADGASSPAERMRISNIGFTTITGSFGRGAPVTKTTSFTLAATENWIICNGAGSITVTFPAASLWTGREVMIKTIAAQTVVSASSNVVPLAGGAAGTAILPATAGAWATLVSDGSSWVIMQS